MAKFSERLCEALQLKNMSAAELSRKIGVHEGTISNYKKGVYEPKQRRLEKISKALNVSIPWLMGYDVSIKDEYNKDLTEQKNMFTPEDEELLERVHQLSPENYAKLSELIDLYRNYQDKKK